MAIRSARKAVPDEQIDPSLPSPRPIEEIVPPTQTTVPGIVAPTEPGPVTSLPEISTPSVDPSGRVFIEPVQRLGSESNSSSESGTVFDQAIRDSAYGGATGFLETGGFSSEDLSNIRARATSPARAVYSNALRNVNRQRALQGGYSPNYTAAMTRMQREMGQATSDAAVNAEASIAQLVQQGKLGGLNALTSMYGNMPQYSRSNSMSRSYDYDYGQPMGGGGGSGGGSGDEEPIGDLPYTESVDPVDQIPDQPLPPIVQQQPKKQGFWGKVGGALKKIGQVALPIALTAIPGVGTAGAAGSIAGSLLNKVGLGGGGAKKGVKIG